MTSRSRASASAIVALALAGLSAIYLLAAVVLFDYTAEPARPFDEETKVGRPVAIGPRPRTWVITPSYDSMFYSGREWPFRLFAPVCAVYRDFKDYAAPTR